MLIVGQLTLQDLQHTPKYADSLVSSHKAPPKFGEELEHCVHDKPGQAREFDLTIMDDFQNYHWGKEL